MAEPFDLEVKDVGDGFVVAVHGEVDLATASRLQTVLGECAHTDVRLDLSDVSFIDSSGLHAIVYAHKLTSGNGRRLEVRGLQPQVRRVFRVTGLEDVLQIAEIG